MNNKFENLKNSLLKLEKQGICLAFSGGIDSALLLYICKDMNIKAVTFESVFQTEEEITETKTFCKEYKINHKIINFFPLNDEKIKNNPKDRCYFCKKLFFEKLKIFAVENNLKYIIDGTNFDDLKTYRPGLKALKELEVISPFAENKITKNEIREYAKNVGLYIYNKPSTPCMATRFPYNTLLVEKNIETVKNCEKILKEYGFISMRVRMHNEICRIEIEKEKFNDFLNIKDSVSLKFKELGVKYVTLDLDGLRSGSMDI